MNKRFVMLAFVLLVLAALACNRTIPTATPQDEAPALTAPTGEGTPLVSPDTPTPDLTSPPTGDTRAALTVTPTGGTPQCIYDADFVTDVTIPDDTRLKPGTEFAKTWRMRNSGTCAWDSGTLWVFVVGDKMEGPDSVGVPATGPGKTADITVRLTAPATPGSYTGYWQLQRSNGEHFGARSFVRIIGASEATLTPTTSATPTPTGEPGAGPVIKYFRSDIDEADPGDTVTLEWETENATSAILYHLMPTGQLGRFWELGRSGTLAYKIDASERNRTDFLLIVSDNAERRAQISLSIRLRCPDTWFFEPAPDDCPAGPAIFSTGAEERFEHGAMIWVQAQDVIYVFFDDGRGPWWRIYNDEWDIGEPEEDPALNPPPGRYQPVRGFGLVWRENPDVRGRLGWAIDPETGFTTAVQRTSRPKYNDIYVLALDDQVWRLLPESSGWEKVPLG